MSGGGTAITPARGNDHARAGAQPRLAVRPRRRVPHLLLGVLVVTVCALAFAVVALRAGGRTPVLALARPVSAGQVLTAADLQVVNVAADAGVALVPAGQADTVVGRTVAVPLPARVLLAPDQLGPATVPAEGQALVGLVLSDGQFPPGLGPGSRVAVVVAAEPGVSAPPNNVRIGPDEGLVVSVTPAAGPLGGTRVGLLLDQDDAAAVAGVDSARVVLVMLPPQGEPG